MLLTFKLLITFTLIRNISNLFHQKSLGSRQNSRWIPFCQNAAKSRGIPLNAITHENRYTPRTGDPTIYMRYSIQDILYYIPNAEMTLPKVTRDLLILPPSLSLCPVAPEESALSLEDNNIQVQSPTQIYNINSYRCK